MRARIANPRYREGILENRTKHSGKNKDGETVDKGYSLNFGNKSEEAREVFEFLASKTKVEFSIVDIGSPGSEAVGNSVVSTSYNEENEPIGAILAEKASRGGGLIRYDHSHPYYDAQEANQSPSDYYYKKRINENTQNLINNPGKKPNVKYTIPKLNVYHQFKYIDF